MEKMSAKKAIRMGNSKVRVLERGAGREREKEKNKRKRKRRRRKVQLIMKVKKNGDQINK